MAIYAVHASDGFSFGIFCFDHLNLTQIPGIICLGHSFVYDHASPVQAVAEMAAIGFGLERDAFTSLMKMVQY